MILPRAELLHLGLWGVQDAPPRAFWLGAERRLLQPAQPAVWRACVSERDGDVVGADQMEQGRRVSVHIQRPGEARGLVLVIAQAREEAREEFEDWYETEHMPRLAAVPGVVYAARYTVGSDQDRALAVYGLSHEEVSQGDDWVAAARTPWTARMKDLTLSFRRLSFRLVPDQAYSVT